LGSLFLFIGGFCFVSKKRILKLKKGMKGQLQKRIEEKLKEADWQDCFLIEIVTNGSKIQVFIDCDSGMTFGRCKKMSRHLEASLDEENYLGGKYILEVSSPGVDRPIFLPRQFQKNLGRNIKFHLKDEEILEGVLKSFENDQLQIESIDPEDKKKKKTIEKILDLNQIDKAFIQISFK
jgi:ribosome maturation factor RimP